MGEYNIRVDDLKQGNDHPVAQAVTHLKTLIDDEGIIYDLDLALTEAVANVVRHAYRGDETGPLTLRIRSVPGRSVELTITDQGQGMSDKMLQRDLPESDAEHGRGIPLMTSLCDHVDFKCEAGANVLTMTKTIPPQAWRS